ncbi:hypothetical protein FRC07_001120 [Ceratobasidium sp. 392]|nr:hypothetical protein FRC07_001120 [Ceratobasidium sp. 392]
MATQQRKFDQEFMNKNWYADSLSEVLSIQTNQLRPIAPAHIFYTLYETAAAVYYHESQIHQYPQTTPTDESVNPNSDFVRVGYMKAAEKLLMLLYSPFEPEKDHPTVVYLRNQLTDVFEFKFERLGLDYVLREAYYEAPKSTDV